MPPNTFLRKSREMLLGIVYTEIGYKITLNISLIK